MAVVQYWIPEHDRGKFVTVFLGELKLIADRPNWRWPLLPTNDIILVSVVWVLFMLTCASHFAVFALTHARSRWRRHGNAQFRILNMFSPASFTGLWRFVCATVMVKSTPYLISTKPLLIQCYSSASHPPLFDDSKEFLAFKLKCVPFFSFVSTPLGLLCGISLGGGTGVTTNFGHMTYFR